MEVVYKESYEELLEAVRAELQQAIGEIYENHVPFGWIKDRERFFPMWKQALNEVMREVQASS